eukprot:scaffold478147_cov19-Prasinocladus_malaysianus.AAC.1
MRQLWQAKQLCLQRTHQTTALDDIFAVVIQFFTQSGLDKMCSANELLPAVESTNRWCEVLVSFDQYKAKLKMYTLSRGRQDAACFA